MVAAKNESKKGEKGEDSKNNKTAAIVSNQSKNGK